MPILIFDFGHYFLLFSSPPQLIVVSGRCLRVYHNDYYGLDTAAVSLSAGQRIS